MAFFSKVGGILKQTVGKQIELRLTPSNPSIFQALRWMSSSKVFIGGLSYSTDDTGLREAFAQYGNVVDARVIVDRESGRSRGFGFITYTSSEEANSAIQALDGQDLHGRRVRVAYATDRARPYGGGFGGGGYGSGGYGGGGYGGAGTNQGGYGGGGGGYGSGGYGGSGSGNQGGVDGYGSGGANYGGGYGGGSFGSSPGGYSAGGSPGGYNASGSPGGYSPGGYNAGGSPGATDAGGNVTADTNFASSGFEEGSGLPDNGGSDQFGIGTSTTSGMEDKAGDYEPNEQPDRDEDENDDFAKRA